ncbi:uncharacterized protein LOC142597766 [Dermatophagoides farinae]|uniref:uncharacterized protein LOC142597766 n=1 Tax=Dermatophagoides farinae TaxID=6954 RepID=UPI003F63CAA7
MVHATNLANPTAAAVSGHPHLPLGPTSRHHHHHNHTNSHSHHLGHLTNHNHSHQLHNLGQHHPLSPPVEIPGLFQGKQQPPTTAVPIVTTGQFSLTNGSNVGGNTAVTNRTSSMPPNLNDSLAIQNQLLTMLPNHLASFLPFLPASFGGNNVSNVVGNGQPSHPLSTMIANPKTNPFAPLSSPPFASSAADFLTPPPPPPTTTTPPTATTGQSNMNNFIRPIMPLPSSQQNRSLHSDIKTKEFKMNHNHHHHHPHQNGYNTINGRSKSLTNKIEKHNQHHHQASRSKSK